MERVENDLGTTLATLERLEAERKLKSIPARLLESAWVLDAQIEAVIHALLITAAAGDERKYVHARHAGEWAARIAAELPCGVSPALMRRCATLAQADWAVLERIPEVRECAGIVRALQSGGNDLACRVIVAAARFDALISDWDGDGRLPGDALRMLSRSAPDDYRPIIDALRRACRPEVTEMLSAKVFLP